VPNDLRNHISILEALSNSICRSKHITIKKRGDKLLFDLRRVHRGLKPVLPYLLVSEDLEGQDTMALNISTEYCEVELNKERSLNKEFSKKAEILISYELYSFVCSEELIAKSSKVMEISKKADKMYVKTSQREYNYLLGPNYCCNLLLPFYKDYLSAISVNITQNKVLVKKAVLKQYIKSFAQRLGLQEPSIKVKNEFYEFELEFLVNKLNKSKIHHIGIINVNRRGELALAESWYSDEGSYGFATAGGFNPTPWHPEYGVMVESEGEFDLKVLDAKKIKIIKTNNYCTGIVTDDNFSGTLKANTSEFKKNSENWYNLANLPTNFQFRDVLVSIKDYYYYFCKEIENTLYLKYNLKTTVKATLGVKSQINEDGKVVMTAQKNFGKVLIKTSGEALPKELIELIKKKHSNFMNKGSTCKNIEIKDNLQKILNTIS
jgi:hypothetical protein